MTDREPVETKNLDIYGHDTLPWSRARDVLTADPAAERPCYLGTVDPDGRPHAAGVGAAYHDGDWWVVSGPGTRKSRNLAADPRCTISTRIEGLDLVLEGRADRVTDPATVERLAAFYRDSGWPVEAQDDTFTGPYSAPSAGPPPWHLYRFTTTTAVGVATAEPHGATRWRFAS
jgi:hypothetical protein